MEEDRKSYILSYASPAKLPKICNAASASVILPMLWRLFTWMFNLGIDEAEIASEQRLKIRVVANVLFFIAPYLLFGGLAIWSWKKRDIDNRSENDLVAVAGILLNSGLALFYAWAVVHRYNGYF